MGKEVLRTLVPLNSLASENFQQLVAKTKIENLSAGEILFNQGDNDLQSIYLLAGEVSLSAENTNLARVIASGTDEARYALAQLKPRQYHGVAKTAVTVARVDSMLLDRLLTVDQATGYEVTEYDGSDDSEWMIRMLRHEAFQKLPASNINALFARMQALEVKSGQVIIKQGDPGDYYYTVKTGKLSVSRKSDKTGKVAMLNQLTDNDSFGEEALLSGAPRNATVVMSSDGILMRLAKQDFDELLKEPLVKWVTEDAARAMVQAGAGLLDVRLEDEFRSGSIKGSLNVPLYLLRLKVAGLNSKRPYVVYCQTGSRSCAAAFLLSQRGFDVYVLRGGLNALTRVV